MPYLVALFVRVLKLEFREWDILENSQRASIDAKAMLARQRDVGGHRMESLQLLMHWQISLLTQLACPIRVKGACSQTRPPSFFSFKYQF